ncbi:prepilin peptidase [uncultured Methylovirgula sp.]|uniref:A24 family peptidase n=1 Tax=uncultured Methylovirgula sp. TaxID=1285960 RepID=UPI00262156A4|nr:prepilin peptidase [uncultured Methylovirgula sp.]
MIFATLVLFPALMAYAAFSDLFTMTISNFVSLALIVIFFVLALALAMPVEDIELHTAAGAMVLLITFFMFARGWIGGGDAKLAAATALWFGFDHLADYSLYAAVLGGVLTLSILVLRRYPLPPVLLGQTWLARLHDKANGVPYGIALAVAGLVLYPETAIWASAVAR